MAVRDARQQLCKATASQRHLGGRVGCCVVLLKGTLVACFTHPAGNIKDRMIKTEAKKGRFCSWKTLHSIIYLAFLVLLKSLEVLFGFQMRAQYSLLLWNAALAQQGISSPLKLPFWAHIYMGLYSMLILTRTECRILISNVFGIPMAHAISMHKY